MRELELKILRGLDERLPGYSNLGESKHIDTQFALSWLYRNEYVKARGPEWKTAMFYITDKGKAYLAELDKGL